MSLRPSRALAAAWCLAGLVACGSGGTPPTVPSSTTTEPPPPTGGSGGTPPPATTITITSSGMSPSVLTIAAGSRVTFTNADNRAHDVSGGPDPATPECPEIDVAGFIAPGQSRLTDVFGTARTCRYHDHAYLGVAAFTGRIVVQ